MVFRAVSRAIPSVPMQYPWVQELRTEKAQGSCSPAGNGELSPPQKTRVSHPDGLWPVNQIGT